MTFSSEAARTILEKGADVTVFVDHALANFTVADDAAR